MACNTNRIDDYVSMHDAPYEGVTGIKQQMIKHEEIGSIGYVASDVREIIDVDQHYMKRVNSVECISDNTIRRKFYIPLNGIVILHYGSTIEASWEINIKFIGTNVESNEYKIITLGSTQTDANNEVTGVNNDQYYSLNNVLLSKLSFAPSQTYMFDTTGLEGWVFIDMYDTSQIRSGNNDGSDITVDFKYRLNMNSTEIADWLAVTRPMDTLDRDPLIMNKVDKYANLCDGGQCGYKVNTSWVQEPTGPVNNISIEKYSVLEEAGSYDITVSWSHTIQKDVANKISWYYKITSTGPWMHFRETDLSLINDGPAIGTIEYMDMVQAEGTEIFYRAIVVANGEADDYVDNTVDEVGIPLYADGIDPVPNPGFPNAITSLNAIADGIRIDISFEHDDSNSDNVTTSFYFDNATRYLTLMHNGTSWTTDTSIMTPEPSGGVALDPGTTYTFYVHASNSVGTTSSSVSETTASDWNGNLDAPMLMVSDLSSDGFKVSWAAIENAETYTWYVDRNGGGYIETTGHTDLFMDVVGVSGDAFKIKIGAAGSDWTEGISSELIITVSDVNYVSEILAWGGYDPDSDETTILWEPVLNADAYKVYANDVFIGDDAELFVDDYGKTLYRFVYSGIPGDEELNKVYVEAIDDADSLNPSKSNEMWFYANQVALMDQVENLRVLRAGSDGVNVDVLLGWDAMVDPDMDTTPSIEVYVDGVSVAVLEVNAIEYLVTGLEFGGAYELVVAAVNDAGKGPTSTLIFNAYYNNEAGSESVNVDNDDPVRSMQPIWLG